MAVSGGERAGAVPASDAGPLTDATLVPGAEWETDGIRYRRAKSGQLQQYREISNGHGAHWRWIFVPDPQKPAKASSLARIERKKRTKQGLDNAKLGAHNFKKAALPFAASPEDRLRVKLRDKQRQITKDGTAPTKLATLAGVHALNFATRYIDGGRDAFIELIQLAMLEGHASALAFWQVFADLPKTERDIVSFDDICCASGVRPSALMAVVVSCAMEMGRDVGNLVAALTHPEVVARAVESAKRIEGVHAEIAFKDRQSLFQHHNFVPLPRGTTINVSASAQAAAASANEPSVPRFAADMGAIDVSKRKLQAQLTEGDSLPTFMRDQPDAAEPIPAELIGQDPPDDEDG